MRKVQLIFLLRCTLVFSLIGLYVYIEIYNVVGGYKISYRESKYEGKSFVTKFPLFIHLNLPNNKCNYRDCVRVAKAALTFLGNPSGGTSGIYKYPPEKLRIRLMPIGTKLKVVKGISLKDNRFLGWLFNPTPLREVIVEDQNGFTYELPEYDLEKILLEKEKNLSKYEKKLLDLKNKIESGEPYTYWGCHTSSIPMDGFNSKELIPKMKDSSVNSSDGYSYAVMWKTKFGPLTELKVASFVNSFNLKGEMKVSEIAVIQENYKNTEGTISSRRSSCSKIIISSVDAYLLKIYHFLNWGLYLDEHNFNEDKSKLCKNVYSYGKYRFSCYDVVKHEKLDFESILNFSDNDIIKYRYEELN